MEFYNVAVVVPVYNPIPPPHEESSFNQTVVVLGCRHDIVLLTYSSLDVSVYERIAKQHSCKLKYIYFDKSYFKDGHTYSILLESKIFYKALLDYDYFLICQLDAWVFRDELQYWCSKGYDYIGAPWLGWDSVREDYTDSLWIVGNGGFSLRRTRYFIDVFSPFRRLYNLKMLIQKYRHRRRQYLLLPLYIIGWHNNFKYLLKTRNDLNEDLFWCRELRDTLIAPLTPSPKEAAYFSFELRPSYLFSLTNQLPMGCHAFKKWEFEIFWCKYIK